MRDHPLSYVHNLIVSGELSRFLHGQSWPRSTSTANPAILAKNPPAIVTIQLEHQQTLHHLLIACSMQVLFSLWCFLTSYIMLTRVHLFRTNTKLWNVQNAHTTSLERQHIPDLDSVLDSANQN